MRRRTPTTRSFTPACRWTRRRQVWQMCRQPPAPTPTAATSRRRALRWRRLSNVSPRRTESGAGNGGGGAPATQNQYPVTLFDPWAERQEERMTFTSFLEDDKRHRRKRVSGERRRCHRMVSRRPGRSDDGAGPSNTPPPPLGASGADAAGEHSADDAFFYASF
jgi:hypothetical protein